MGFEPGQSDLRDTAARELGILRVAGLQGPGHLEDPRPLRTGTFLDASVRPDTRQAVLRRGILRVAATVVLALLGCRGVLVVQLACWILPPGMP